MKKKLRKWLAFIMVFSCVATCLPGFTYGAAAVPAAGGEESVGSGSSAAKDDLSGHWAETQLRDMMKLNVIGGYQDGTVRPDQAVNRAEFVTMVNKSCDFKESASISFTDVASGDWYYTEIAKGTKAGYVSGYTDGTFRPEQSVSRVEAASMLMKVYGLTADAESAAAFKDAASIPDWAKGAVGAVVKAGIMKGNPDGTFKGETAMTRAEAGTVLHQKAKDTLKSPADQTTKPAVTTPPATGGGSSHSGGGGGGGGKTNIADYSAAFRADIPEEGIAKAILVYSTDLLYRDSIQNLKRDYIVEDGRPTAAVNEDKLTVEKAEALVAANKAKALTGSIAKGTKVSFAKNQLTLDGKTFGKDVYFPYIITIGSDGAVEIYDSMEYVITAANPKPKTDVVREGKGIVWPIGGATSEENYRYIGEQAAVGLPDGVRPKVAILNSSRDYDTGLTYMYDTEDDPDFGTYEKIFGDAGMDIVWIPLNYDSLYYFKNVSYYSELIKTCDAVYLMGGDQMLHARCLLNEDGSDNAYMKAIRCVLSRGGFITGTSAGCHIMSNPIYSLGESYDTMYLNLKGEWGELSQINDNGETETWVDGTNLYTHGTGLIPEGYLIESHFDARGRLGRLIAGLRDGYKDVTVGIGPDESTGVQIQEVSGEKIGTVVGPRGVFFVDASNAEYSEPGTTDAAGDFNVTGLRIDYLTEGDTYNFYTKEIVIAAGKTDVAEQENGTYLTPSIFGAYDTTKAILNLAETTALTSGGISGGDDDAVNFMVTFEKGEGYQAKSDGSGYADTPELTGFDRISVLGMKVSVEKIGELPTDGDVTAPVISYVKHYSKPYSAWIGITDDFSGIDKDSVDKTTVQIISAAGTDYYRTPEYSKGDGEIEVTIKQDEFAVGDQIKIEGVKDRAGNAVETQTWEKQADGSWTKLPTL